MRKVVVSTMVSLDGVMENPQNWSFDYWNDELGKYAYDQLFTSDVLVMGRMTYEAFAEAWSARADDAFADRINAMPKFVASRTLNGSLAWNASLITDDPAQAVARLRQQPGENILQYGTGELTHTLLQAGLVDELRLLVYPVIVGTGARYFEHVDPSRLKLIDTRTFDTGVIALHYQPLADSDG